MSDDRKPVCGDCRNDVDKQDEDDMGDFKCRGRCGILWEDEIEYIPAH